MNAAVLMLMVAADRWLLAATVGEPCTVDAAGTRGDCRVLSHCPELLQLARDIRRGLIGSEGIDKLKRLVSVCPPGPRSPQVCCQNELTRRPSTAPPRPRSVGRLPTEAICGRQTFGARVTGGENASIGQFPWMASIQFSTGEGPEREHGCGGTLITKRHVLTAAHCVSFISDRALQPRSVILGELDFDSERDCLRDMPNVCAEAPIEVEIDGILSHPRFENINRLGLPNDIAILSLAKEVNFTDFVTPICLPTDPSVFGGENADIAPRSTAFVAGWGRTEIDGGDDFSPVLQFARLPIQPLQSCVTDFQLEGVGLQRRVCAGAGENGSDTCRGDSGGPLMVPVKQGTRWYQTGISSFGTASCGQLAGYTRIVDYMDWIMENISLL